MDATILNYSKASFEALYSDNIRKNVAVEDLKRGIIALNSKDDTVKEATNFTSQVIVISEELKMNLEDKFHEASIGVLNLLQQDIIGV
ncbi:hypothetical protein V6N13_086633 [Hibiscus sabdariffa]